MEYKALFLDEYLNELGNKKFQPTDEFITFKKGTFNIRLDAFLYRSKNITYYGYIYPTDEKLLIDNVKIEPIKEDKDKTNKTLISARLIKIKEKLEKGDLKLIVGENIIGQLARMAVMGLKNNWVLIIIIAASVGIGTAGIGYSIGVNSGISQANSLINSTINNSGILIPTPTPIIIHP
jgi:hypothetical protein